METGKILQFTQREIPDEAHARLPQDTDASIVAISADVARLRSRSESETNDVEMTLEQLTTELTQYQEIQRQIAAEREIVQQRIADVEEHTDPAAKKSLYRQLRQLNQSAVTLQQIIRDTSERWGDMALYLKFGMPIPPIESDETA